MNRPTPIPWTLLLIGSGFLVMMLWSILLASQRTSAVVDRNYYSHGLRYNETLLERRAAASLGWTSTTRLHNGQVTTRLRDRDQQAVSQAQATLTLLGAGQQQVRQLALQEFEPGTYQAQLPAGMSGEQPVELAFERAGARLSKRLLLSLP